MQAPAYSLAGRLNLGELAAALQMALFLIANNTGPVHIAAAVGAPVVDLYALTNPQHTPWQVPHRVLSFDVPCKYCYKSVCPQGHHACLREISPESVVAAAVDLLEQSSSGAYVTYEGSAMPCCMISTPDRLNFGNFKQRDALAIWNSREYVQFRNQLESGVPHEVCQSCSVYRGIF
jgi:radical SAM protein with 4Fe4S-binding SPASM domain